MKRVGISLVSIVLILGGSVCSLAADGGELTVVINEICWGGATWGATAEWIELFNLTGAPIDLEGWTLSSSDGAPRISLHGVLPARSDADGTGYFLLERDSDDAVPGVTANIIYSGALTDAGESLSLFDADGRLVDTANSGPPRDDGAPPAWPAGQADAASSAFASMERVTFGGADIPSNWASCILTPPNDGSPFVPGTPGQENSVYNLPPIAQIDIIPRVPQPGVAARFDASRSSDANDVIVSYRWDFGDGGDADGPVVEHVYEQAGAYTVLLTVTDAKGGQAVLFQNVQVAATTPPVADFSIRRKSEREPARVGDLLTFQDESYDADGDVVAWDWAFGDGTTAASSLATHSYDAAGTYVVRLEVADGQGETALQTQALTIAPRLSVALFSYTPDPPHAGEVTRLDASESAQFSGTITSYIWDFDGDGTTDVQTSSSSVEHVFPTGGPTVVRLTVVDEQDNRASRERILQINDPPVAQFQIDDFSPDELEFVSFVDCSWDRDGEIVEWLWEFGDGSTSTVQTASHAYRASGEMRVLLLVTDDGGAMQTASAIVTVQNLPPTANLSASSDAAPTGSTLTFDASASFDPTPDGCITKYEWNLGDEAGYTVETEDPMLSRSFDEDGQVCVRVRVMDDDGATAVSDPVTVTVTNRSPSIALVQWTPTDPVDGEPVTLSVSASDPDGQIMRWMWSVDGVVQSTQQSFVTTFDDDGDYEITVQVTDDDGASVPRSVSVSVANAAPVATFSTARGSACGPTGVRFDATASYDPSPTGKIVHVGWDFGDGTSCPGEPGCDESSPWTPEHCYSASGTYTVILFVIDEQGAMARVERTILIGD